MGIDLKKNGGLQARHFLLGILIRSRSKAE